MLLFVKKITLLLQDIKNFGILQSTAFIVYNLYKKFGLYRFLTPKKRKLSTSEKVEISPFKFAETSDLEKSVDQDQIKIFADRILRGEFLAFGETWQPLEFMESDFQAHWSSAKIKDTIGDIKIIWEPARFDWSLWLAKVYHLTKDETYYQQFKKICTRIY